MQVSWIVILKTVWNLKKMCKQSKIYKTAEIVHTASSSSKNWVVPTVIIYNNEWKLQFVNLHFSFFLDWVRFLNVISRKIIAFTSELARFFWKNSKSQKTEVNESKDPMKLLCYLKNCENLSESKFFFWKYSVFNTNLLEFPDSNTAIQLLVLPRLIPPRERIKSVKSHWKFSTLEETDALIIQCQVK